MLPPPLCRHLSAALLQAVAAFLEDVRTASASQGLAPPKPLASTDCAARCTGAQPSCSMPSQCGGMRGGMAGLPSGVMANLMASAGQGCNPMMGCNPMLMMQQQAMMQQAMQQQAMMQQQQQQVQGPRPSHHTPSPPRPCLPWPCPPPVHLGLSLGRSCGSK